jgi:hypothetical protein
MIHVVFSHCEYSYTVPLYKSKLFISRSCPIFVLATVMGRSSHAEFNSLYLKNHEK